MNGNEAAPPLMRLCRNSGAVAARLGLLVVSISGIVVTFVLLIEFCSESGSVLTSKLREPEPDSACRRTASADYGKDL
jgi:hypothetical protein